MIPIFRRIRRRLLSQNRLSKYLLYAVGEILLVVIGILIALQINAWNDHRKDREKEQAYLHRLQDELEFDKKYLRINREFYGEVFEAGSLVLTSIEDEQGLNNSQWEILVSFFHASQIWPIKTVSATFDELKSTGDLSLILNISIRNNLSFYHGGGLQRYSETLGINPPYRKMVRGMIPAKIQNYMWENCHATEGDIQKLLECEPMISEVQSEEINRMLIGNEELISELRFYMSSIKVGLTTLVEQEKLCMIILEEIEAQISKPN